MAETSGFFDAVYDEEIGEYDLMYLAEQFASYFSLFIGNGVFISPTNQLKVHAGEGLTVTVEPGWAFIDGYWYHNDEQRILNIPPNATTQVRTDSVKCRLDYANRSIHSLYFTSDTEVERSGNYHDLKLANVIVRVASVQILEADITDTRMNESVCGFVKSLMEVASTEDLFSQYDSIFEIWFDKLKDSLGEDPATNLQAQIGFLQDLETEVKTDLVSAMNWLLDRLNARNILYDNSDSELEADNVQDAIDELKDEIDTKVTNSFTANRAVYANANGELVASGTVTGTELGYLDGVTSNIQTQLNNKLNKGGHAVNKAVVTDGNGNITPTGITSAEIGALSGVTSNIQTQLNSKATSASTSQVRFQGINLSASNIAYIYTEDDNVNFRYKASNGVTAYANLRTIPRATVNGTTLNITLG